MESKNKSIKELLTRIKELENENKVLKSLFYENGKGKNKEFLQNVQLILNPGNAVNIDKQPRIDYTKLNNKGIILNTVGPKILNAIVNDFMVLLETSCAVYEKNGDYALGIFSSGWCKFLDSKSYKHSKSNTLQEAVNNGKWHCHESCWKDASQSAIETGKPTDVKCRGGLQLYTVPIKIDEEVIGAINFGYGNPPLDEEKLNKIAADFNVDFSKLKQISKKYKPRPQFIIDLAKNRLEKAAAIISLIVERKRTVDSLVAAKDHAEVKEKNLKKINEELNNRNIFIQTILDNLPIGLALNNINDGTATYMNKKFEEIYGWKSEEIASIGTFFNNIYPDQEYRKSITERVMADIKTGDPEKMHWENIVVTRKDQKQRIVNAVNIPLMEQNTMVSTVMDITELQQIQKDLTLAKEKAEISNSLKTAFLQNMSHEIRTPMNAIIGFSNLINDPDLTPQKREGYSSIIINSGNQLLSIVNDILTISALETKQEKVNSEKTSINGILTDLYAIFKPQAEVQNITLKLKETLSVSESQVFTDATKLTQILTNLISNALKFTHEGTIEFGYSLKKPNLEFYVKDTGIGIQKNQQNAIFERFNQGDYSSTRKYEGTGLGLSISKGFTELMGGKIRVESEVGKGSVFYFTIPYKPVNDKT